MEGEEGRKREIQWQPANPLADMTSSALVRPTLTLSQMQPRGLSASQLESTRDDLTLRAYQGTSKNDSSFSDALFRKHFRNAFTSSGGAKTFILDASVTMTAGGESNTLPQQVATAAATNIIVEQHRRNGYSSVWHALSHGQSMRTADPNSCLSPRTSFAHSRPRVHDNIPSGPSQS